MKTLTKEELGIYALKRSGPHAYLSDGALLTYYADLDCKGSTEFCKRYCYAWKYPQGELDTTYRLQDFHSGVVGDVFKAHKIITFFGRGTLSSFDVPPEELIVTISKWYPEKLFRFYLRELPQDIAVPRNCYPHLALDHTSGVSIDDVIANKTVRVVTVVDHRANTELVARLREYNLQVSYCPGTPCSECIKPEFGGRKTLLIQKIML